MKLYLINKNNIDILRNDLLEMILHYLIKFIMNKYINYNKLYKLIYYWNYFVYYLFLLSYLSLCIL